MTSQLAVRGERMVRVGVAIGLIVLSLGIPLDASAVCLTPRPAPVLNDAYSYLSAFVSSVWQANQAEIRGKLDPAKTVTQLMVQLKLGQEDYRCAGSFVTPFANSDDKMIAEAADPVGRTYDGMVELNNRAISEIVALLNQTGPQAASGLGTYLDKLSGIAAGKAQLWEVLMSASGMGRYVLVKFTPQGEGTGRFRISAAQRRDLMKQLEQKFGAVVRTGPKADKAGTIDAAEGSASILYSFLADKAWKSTDD